MMKLAMATLHSDLKPTVGLEQGDQFLDFHFVILPRVLSCGLTLKLSGAPPPTWPSKKLRTLRGGFKGDGMVTSKLFLAPQPGKHAAMIAFSAVLRSEWICDA